MDKFELVSDYKPTGDQPKAIRQLVDGLRSGMREQALLGVTGSGKSSLISTTRSMIVNGSLYRTFRVKISASFRTTA